MKMELAMPMTLKQAESLPPCKLFDQDVLTAGINRQPIQDLQGLPEGYGVDANIAIGVHALNRLTNTARIDDLTHGRLPIGKHHDRVHVGVLKSLHQGAVQVGSATRGEETDPRLGRFAIGYFRIGQWLP